MVLSLLGPHKADMTEGTTLISSWTYEKVLELALHVPSYDWNLSVWSDINLSFGTKALNVRSGCLIFAHSQWVSLSPYGFCLLDWISASWMQGGRLRMTQSFTSHIHTQAAALNIHRNTCLLPAERKKWSRNDSAWVKCALLCICDCNGSRCSSADPIRLESLWMVLCSVWACRGVCVRVLFCVC